MNRPNPGIGAGFLYHERGRGELAYVGEFAVIDSTGKRTVVGKVGDANALKQAGYYRNGDWNEFTIRAHGNRLNPPGQRLPDRRNDRQRRQSCNARRDPRPADPCRAAHARRIKDIWLKVLDAGLDSPVRKFNDQGQTGWVAAPEPPK